MLPAVLVFLFVTGIILAGFAAATQLPGVLASRRLDRRLREVSTGVSLDSPSEGSELVRRVDEGPLPVIDRLVARSGAGSGLARLIEQSGVRTTPSAIVLISLMAAVAGGLLVGLLTRHWVLAPVGAAVAAFGPLGWLKHRRTVRFKRFEEQFPEALDLLSRAIRAGHAFQTALGMAADELPPPCGVEFKKTFDQQNFGLPLRDALNDLTERMAILDVRFFVTAVLIQRETGGNLAEILDNLAHVVRERFKVLRQVRVHTAHGRFTGYVLLALPAFLAVALSFLNPDHMGPLFHERMGQMMLISVLVMQTVGYFWIKQVIKIEV
jgi:tight adherence protein B